MNLAALGDPGDDDDLVSKGTSLLVGSRNVDASWQPPEAISKVEVQMAIGDVAQDHEEGISGKLPGLVCKMGGFSFLMCPQPFDQSGLEPHAC